MCCTLRTTTSVHKMGVFVFNIHFRFSNASSPFQKTPLCDLNGCRHLGLNQYFLFASFIGQLASALSYMFHLEAVRLFPMLP